MIDLDKMESDAKAAQICDDDGRWWLMTPAETLALIAVAKAAREFMEWRLRAAKHEPGAVMGMEFAGAVLRTTLEPLSPEQPR